MPDERLVAAVDGVEPVAFHGEVFRHIDEGRDPLSGTGARIQGGRWNPPESFATLYMALDRDTVAAEFARAVRRSGLREDAFLPRRMYRYEIGLAAVLDLRGASSLAAFELDERTLSSDDPSRCQAVGEAAHHAGREGLLAPSATGPGFVLAIYLDRLHPGSLVRPIDFERWEAELIP